MGLQTEGLYTQPPTSIYHFPDSAKSTTDSQTSASPFTSSETDPPAKRDVFPQIIPKLRKAPQQKPFNDLEPKKAANPYLSSDNVYLEKNEDGSYTAGVIKKSGEITQTRELVPGVSPEPAKPSTQPDSNGPIVFILILTVGTSVLSLGILYDAIRPFFRVRPSVKTKPNYSDYSAYKDLRKEVPKTEKESYFIPTFLGSPLIKLKKLLVATRDLEIDNRTIRSNSVGQVVGIVDKIQGSVVIDWAKPNKLLGFAQ